jgi:prepilin peptidase CpaA
MTPSNFAAGVAIAVALVAVIADVRTQRIPNVLTFGAAAVAFLYGFATGGFHGLTTSLLGWVVGVALFFPIFALGGMGAGDVKLLGALAAWLGPGDSVYLALFASIAGGAIALGVSTARGYLRTALSNVWLMLAHWRVAGPSAVPGMTLSDSKAPRLAYAIPIAIGVLCTLWRR